MLDKTDYKRLKQALDHTLQSLGHLRIPFDSIEIDEARQLGEGGFADVWAGVLTRGPNDVEEVAVKTLRSAGTPRKNIHIAIALAREMRVWATLEHTNILPFFGFYLDEKQHTAWILSPLMPNGNVNNYVKRMDPDRATRIRIIVELTRALAYLHGRKPPVCHGDLKPDNILIEGNGEVVLSDFGLTVIPGAKPSGLTTEKTLKGTTRYLAPELIDEDEPSRTLKSDIWAWGCVVAEDRRNKNRASWFMTDEVPYSDCSNDFKVMKGIASGPPRLLRTVRNFPSPLLQWACETSPQDRTDVFRCLEGAEIAHKNSGAMAAEDIPPTRRYFASVAHLPTVPRRKSLLTNSSIRGLESQDTLKDADLEESDREGSEADDSPTDYDQSCASDSDGGDPYQGIFEDATYIQISVDGGVLGVVKRGMILVVDIETGDRKSLDLSSLSDEFQATPMVGFSPDFKYCAIALRTLDDSYTLHVWEPSNEGWSFEDHTHNATLDRELWNLHPLNEDEVLAAYTSKSFQVVNRSDPSAPRHIVKYQRRGRWAYNLSLRNTLLAITASMREGEHFKIDIRNSSELKLVGSISVPEHLIPNESAVREIAISEGGTILILDPNFSIWYCNISEALTNPPLDGRITSPIQLVAYHLSRTFSYAPDPGYLNRMVLSGDGTWVMLHGESMRVILDLQTLALYELKRVENSRISGSSTFLSLPGRCDGLDIVYVKKRSHWYIVSSDYEIWRYEARRGSEPVREESTRLAEFDVME